MVHAQDTPNVDELISVEELALRWRTAASVVARLVASREIPSLDGGALARAGQLDVPVLRSSWAEGARVESPGAIRRLDLELVNHMHPAAQVAVDLHGGLSDRDDDVVWACCSAASHAFARDPRSLTEAWLDVFGDIFNRDTGIASGVYALVPHRGVGVRLVGGLGPLTIRYEQPTPQAAIGMFVLVEENQHWRADVQLSSLEVDYFELTRSAPPDGWTPAEGALP